MGGSPLLQALTGVLGVFAALTNLVFWWWVVTRGDERARRLAESVLGVSITRGARGHWDTDAGCLTQIAVFVGQLGFFVGAFAVWATLLVGTVVLMGWLQGATLP